MSGPDRASRPVGRGVSPGNLIAAALVLCLTVWVYLPVAAFDFVNFDDHAYVSENPRVLAGVSMANVSWALTSFDAGNWHPLTWISHMVDVELFGSAPGPQHVVNLSIHALNTLLLFLWLRLATGSLWRSAMVAALFGVHPLHVESVAWISERKDVLSACFGLLALISYTRYAQTGRTGPYLAAATLLAVGLMAKPMLVTLPLLMLLTDIWPLRRLSWPLKIDRTFRRLVVEKLPLLALSAVASVLTVIAQQRAQAVQDVSGFPIADRIANAAAAYISYLTDAVWPSGLAVFYPLEPVPLAYAAVCVVALLTAGVLAMRIRRPYAAVGWFWFLGSLVPVIGLVQVGWQAHADRYTYLPLIGIFVTVVWGVADLGKGRKSYCTLGRVAFVTVVLALAWTARAQVMTWRDSSTLWSHALEVTSNNAVAHTGAGDAFTSAGQHELALRHYAEAFRISPQTSRYRQTYAASLSRHGLALLDGGRRAEGMRALVEAIRLDPALAVARTNLATALADAGRLAEALTHFEEVLRLESASVSATTLNNLGTVLAQLGRFEEAESRFREAVSRDPAFAQARENLERVRAIRAKEKVGR